jgi:hypothetical protein
LWQNGLKLPQNGFDTVARVFLLVAYKMLKVTATRGFFTAVVFDIAVLHWPYA